MGGCGREGCGGGVEPHQSLMKYWVREDDVGYLRGCGVGGQEKKRKVSVEDGAVG